MRPRLLLGLLLVAACGSFRDGTSTPPPAPDAGSSDADASPPLPTDGGTPIEDDGGIPLPKACDVLYLCDEFERSTAPDVMWTGYNQVSGGLAIATTFSKSPTRSLHVTLAAAADNDGRAYLRKDIVPKARRLTARFWLRPEAIPAGRDIVFAEIETDDGVVFLMFQNGQLVLTAQNTARTQSSGAPETLLPVGQAYSIVFDYRGGATPKAVVYVNTTRLELDISSGGGDATEFVIGATFARSGGIADYYIDDVHLDRGL